MKILASSKIHQNKFNLLFCQIITGLGAPEPSHGNLASAPSTNVRFKGEFIKAGGDSINK
jgi:hypothetical protein